MSSHLNPNLELLLPEVETMDLGFGYQHEFVIFLKFKIDHRYDSINSVLLQPQCRLGTRAVGQDLPLLPQEAGEGSQPKLGELGSQAHGEPSVPPFPRLPTLQVKPDISFPFCMVTACKGQDSLIVPTAEG